MLTNVCLEEITATFNEQPAYPLDTSASPSPNVDPSGRVGRPQTHLLEIGFNAGHLGEGQWESGQAQ